MGIWLLGRAGINAFSTNLLCSEGMCLAFGGYFWLFVKERLPSYYDENKISAYSDGVFRMNVPGVNFNNKNWPHIVKGMRVLSAAALVMMPAVYLLQFVF